MFDFPYGLMAVEAGAFLIPVNGDFDFGGILSLNEGVGFAI